LAQGEQELSSTEGGHLRMGPLAIHQHLNYFAHFGVFWYKLDIQPQLNEIMVVIRGQVLKKE
jgi:hypothetical protein